MSSKQNSKNPFIAKDFNELSNKDIVLHSQSKPNKNSQIFNPFINNTNQNQIKNSVNKNDAKENKSQLLFNTTNKNPFLDRINSNDKSNGIIRIQVFKSHVKPHLSMNPAQTEKSEKLKLSKQKTVVKEEQSDNTPLNLNQINAEKIQYKMLIKKIAMQLKKKIRPRTKGFFYMKVIRSEKYMNIVKKIALSLKNKLGIHPPTRGAFGSYIQKEEEMKLQIKEKKEKYKLLIKKIASQLRKRVKLPTCKIIKIYESYRALIKRIALALKKSMKSLNQVPPTPLTDGIQISNDNNVKEQQNIVVEEINNEKCMDIDMTDAINNENEEKKEIINNVIEEENHNEDNNMDIEMDNNNEIKVETPQISQKNIIQTESKKSSQEKNEIKTSTNNQELNMISTMKKKPEEISNNFTFSKMEVLENRDLPNSSECKSPIEESQINKEIPEVKINSEDLIDSNIKEEIHEQEEKIICEEKDAQPEINCEKINHTEKKEEGEREKNQNKNENYLSKSAKNKGEVFKFSLMKKEDFDKFNIIRKKENKSHSKSNIKLNIENLHELFNKITTIENKENIGNINNNLTLQDIETTKANFINQFQLFLSQENIEIINNFPVSTNEKNIYLFQQSNFWYLVMTFLFYKNNNLSFYNILYLLDQYNAWANDKTLELFNSMKARIIDYITSNKSQEVINQFLFMNKLENLDKIFEKFESPLIYPELDAKNKICKEYQEIKVDDINFMYVKKEEKCKCELCTSDAACIQKVCDLNKSRMEIVNNSSIDFLKKEITPEDIIKKNNSCIVFHNNEELFYQGKSEKKSNTIFSKSKTIFDERGRLEFIPQPISISHPTTFVKEEKIENTESNVVNENEKENEDKKINNNEVTPSEFDKNVQEVQEQEKNVDMEMDMEVLSDTSPKKSFKNISKSEKKPTEEEVNIENDIAIKSEGKEPHESEIEKNEEDNSEDETKNIKKEKKSRKGKSRKKNSTKINNKKKKDSITKERKEAEKEDVKDEPKEEEKEEKSVKKKRKSTNRSSLKKNKSKNCVKDEEKEEKEEKAESEIINIGSKSEKKLEMEPNINNSKRKKSKTPNKKKSRKH